VVRKWQVNQTRSLRIGPEQVFSIVPFDSEPILITRSVIVKGRKELQPEWFESEVKADAGSVTPGLLGGGMKAWVDALKHTTKETVHLNQISASDANTLAKEWVGKNCIQSVRNRMMAHDIAVIAGDSVALDTTIRAVPQEAPAHHEGGLRIPLLYATAILEGVRT